MLFPLRILVKSYFISLPSSSLISSAFNCVCCEGRGQEKFLLGNWKTQDIRDLWWGERHLEIYNNINTHLCPPCKPNRINNLIQKDMNDPSLLERVIM